MRFGPSVGLILALIFVAPGTAREVGRARYLASFIWVEDKPWFGGLSGLEISSDGSGLIAITDRGHMIWARIKRDKDLISGIDLQKWWRLKSSSGKPLTRKITDSEGLAIGGDQPRSGPIHISFEGVTRVARYRKPRASAVTLPHHDAFKALPENKSLEALAIDSRNRLIAFPEELDNDARIRGFVWENGNWSLGFTLQGGNGFLPVGADFGPDGRLYLLERGWNIFGFRTRVRRWDMTNNTPNNEQLLIRTWTGMHDNLEGLAVWRDLHWRIRLTMVSDDNFLAVQRTELVEYVVSQ